MTHYFPRRLSCLKVLLASLALTLATTAGAQSPASPPQATEAAEPGAPLRLRQPQEARPLTPLPVTSETPDHSVPVYQPGEFERFVQRYLAAGAAEVRRLGAELMARDRGAPAGDLTPSVPADYLVAPGDEVLIALWGSVDADLRLVVDRAGRVTLPRVGTVHVAGLRYGELQATIERRVARTFRNFEISVSLGQLRGIRVFVTGFVVRPGAYTVSALSTVVAALMQAGGPSAAGSFRQIELRRRGELVARIDLYDLLLNGDRSADRIIQAGDVVHVASVGPQVGIVGSVNHPVVAELVPGETVQDALRMAGGFTAVADRSRLAIERLSERMAERVRELALPRDAALELSQGDVLRAISAAESILSVQRQNKRVRVDGEVNRPGEYVLPPESTLLDAVQAAGGFSPSAYLNGAQFMRESVRATQQENYARALRDLETDFARAAASQRTSTSDEAVVRDAQSAAAARLIERLRALQPTGRVVLQMPADGSGLPALVLEDGDRLYVPPRPTTVGVFGSVFNAGSYLYGEGRSLDDYLRLAGGPTKGADENSIFVVRANGEVISARQRDDSAWFGRRAGIGAIPAEPGDTVFVPEEMDRTTFVQSAKDWTQILYQFGIGLAGLVNVFR